MSPVRGRLYQAIGPILDTVSAAECANYFANAGYDQTQYSSRSS
jgi:hypothetical protein